MNKIKFIIAMTLVILTTFIINSCSKQDSFINEPNLQANSNQKIALPSVDVNKIINGFSSQMAVFSSRNEFAAFLSEFNKLPEESQKILLNNIKYETVQDILDAAYAGMDSIQTREEFIEYLSEYSDYLKLVTLPNGEEEVVEKDITGHSAYNFLNSAKIIKVGNIYQKYFSKLCVESEDLELLKSIHNENEVRNSRLKYFIACTYNPSEIQGKNQIDSRWGESDLIRTWELQNDAFWCKNKRKVEFEIGFKEDIFIIYDPLYGYVYQSFVIRKGNVTAKRKGIPCIWYKYNTTITWNGFHAEYDVKRNGVTTHEVWSHSDEQKYGSSIDRGELFYLYYPNFGQSFDCQWNVIQSEITTTGLGGEWLIVDFPN